MLDPSCIAYSHIAQSARHGSRRPNADIPGVSINTHQILLQSTKYRAMKVARMSHQRIRSWSEDDDDIADMPALELSGVHMPSAEEKLLIAAAIKDPTLSGAEVVLSHTRSRSCGGAIEFQTEDDSFDLPELELLDECGTGASSAVGPGTLMLKVFQLDAIHSHLMLGVVKLQHQDNTPTCSSSGRSV